MLKIGHCCIFGLCKCSLCTLRLERVFTISICVKLERYNYMTAWLFAVREYFIFLFVRLQPSPIA